MAVQASLRIALAAAAAMAGGAAGAQNVDIQPNGIQVGFPGGNCSVYYDRAGRFLSARPGCNSGQVQRANAAVAARVRPNYAPAPGGAVGNAPRAFVASNGAGQVVYPRSRCTVRYQAFGARIPGPTACTHSQLRTADRLFRAERLRRGFR